MSVKSFEHQGFTDFVSGHFTQGTLHVTCLTVIPAGKNHNAHTQAKNARTEPIRTRCETMRLAGAMRGKNARKPSHNRPFPISLCLCFKTSPSAFHMNQWKCIFTFDNCKFEKTLRWTSIPSRGEKQYSKSLHATETGVNRRPDGPPGSYADYVEGKLALPKPHTNYLKRSFSYRGALLWNNLPQEMRDTDSIGHFKRKISNRISEISDSHTAIM